MPTYISAIEIGSSRIKGAIGILNDDATLNIVAIEEQPLAVGAVRYGCVLNVDEVSNKINVIRKFLENNPYVSPRKINSAFVGLGGRSLVSTPTESVISMDNEREIGPGVIKELRKRAKATFKMSNKEVLEAVPMNYTVDDKLMNNPVGIYGSEIKGKFNLIICDDRNKKNLKRAFDKSDLKIKGFFSRVLTVEKLVLTGDDKLLGCVIVDMGAETTTVSVYKDGALKYLTTIPMGSRFITRDLAHILNVTEERAEEIKLHHVNLNQTEAEVGERYDQLDERLINNIVQARVSEIITNIKNQIDLSKIKREDLTAGIILMGNGAKLNGMKEALHRETTMNVRKASLVESVRCAPNLSLPMSDAIDVVSILISAVRNGENLECTTGVIQAEQPDINLTNGTTGSTDNSEQGKEKKKKSGVMDRIGRLFENLVREEDFDEEDDEQ